MSTSDVDATLAERGTRYGEFIDHSRYAQDLKRAMQRVPANWHKLSDDKKEALEMVVHKIGRILNGDPEYIDSWHDIIGYVRLVEKNLEAAQAPASNPLSNSTIEGNIRAMTAVAGHYCAASKRTESGHSVECEACKTVIYGPRVL